VRQREKKRRRKKKIDRERGGYSWRFLPL